MKYPTAFPMFAPLTDRENDMVRTNDENAVRRHCRLKRVWFKSDPFIVWMFL